MILDYVEANAALSVNQNACGSLQPPKLDVVTLFDCLKFEVFKIDAVPFRKPVCDFHEGDP